MNKKLTCAAILCAGLITMGKAHAQGYNNTVMTTSDSAPTYPTSGANRNTEVVIGTASNQSAVTTSVTLTSTCVDGGKVTMSYTYSSGISFAAGYPQGSNTGTEIAKFNFDSTTIGKVNTIQVVVAGRLDSNGAYCSVNNSNPPVFKICIPMIQVTRVAGDTTSNLFRGYLFHTNPIITGCDDFTQIQWVQMIKEHATQTDFAGTVSDVVNNTNYIIDAPTAPSGWASPSPSNTPWTFAISGNTATLSNPDNQTDTLASLSTTIGGQLYDYVNYFSDACLFQDKIRRTADTHDLGEWDWKFTWDNYNDTWGASPTLAQYTTATGNTSGAYGGAHPGTKQGEWSNVGNISVP